MKIFRLTKISFHTLICLFIYENNYDGVKFQIAFKNLQEKPEIMFDIFTDIIKHDKTGNMSFLFYQDYDYFIDKMGNNEIEGEKMLKTAYECYNLPILLLFIKNKYRGYKIYKDLLRNLSDSERNVKLMKIACLRKDIQGILNLIEDGMPIDLVFTDLLFDEEKDFMFEAKYFSNLKTLLLKIDLLIDFETFRGQELVIVVLKLFLKFYNLEGIDFLLKYLKKESETVQKFMKIIFTPKFVITAVFYNAMCFERLDYIDKILRVYGDRVNLDTFAIDLYTGENALHIACANGLYKVVEHLVDVYNEDIGIRNKSGYLPIEIADQNGHFRIVKFLFERTPDISNLEKYWDYFEKAKSQDPNMLRLLLRS